MGREIERKFLVKGGFEKAALGCVHVVQGYLSSDPQRIVRVRLKGEKGYLTVKGPGALNRFEWEQEISADEAEALLSLAEPGIVDKTRYLVPAGDGRHTWEVDVFHGDNEGLVVAEIELSSEDDPFDRPDWLGEEVTGDPRYYNSSLRAHPYKEWK